MTGWLGGALATVCVVGSLALWSQGVGCICDFMCNTVNLVTTPWISMTFASIRSKVWQISSTRSCIIGYDQGKYEPIKRKAADVRSLVVIFLIHHEVPGQKRSEGL